MKQLIVGCSIAALVIFTGMTVDAGCGACGPAKGCGPCGPDKMQAVDQADCCGVCGGEKGAACDKKCGDTCKSKGACGSARKTKGACGMEKKGHSHGHADEAVIDTQALSVMLEAKADVVVLDARSGKYDDGRRIPGAKSLNASSSEKEVRKAIGKDKDQLVVTYCSNVQCPASSQLAAHLKKLGYENVIEYPRGIQGWVEDGKEVEQ